MSLPTSNPVSGAPSSEPAPPPRRCRSLTVSGLQCRARALRGHDLCVAHAQYRFPVCPKGPRVAIPLLESLDTIQVVVTQVAQGLFAETLDPLRAGKILYACQVAALTIPRPAPLKSAGQPTLAPVPVADVYPSVDGTLLGPRLAWTGDHSAFNPVWNYHKHAYEQECDRLGKPRPLSPQDMPPDGWLTSDEIAEKQTMAAEDFNDIFRERILNLRIEADRHGELPPLNERTCAHFTFGNCEGPASNRPCDFCLREREEHLRLPPRPAPDSIGDLEGTAGDASEIAPERSRFTPVRRPESRCQTRQLPNLSNFQQLPTHPHPGGRGERTVASTRGPQSTGRRISPRRVHHED